MCLTMLDAISACIIKIVAACLARCLLNEGARCSSAKQAITPVRYDEGTIATNHDAATGERGYHNTSPPGRAVYAYS